MFEKEYYPYFILLLNSGLPNHIFLVYIYKIGLLKFLFFCLNDKLPISNIKNR